MNLKVGIDAYGVLTDMLAFLIREGKEFFNKYSKDSDTFDLICFLKNSFPSLIKNSDISVKTPSASIPTFKFIFFPPFVNS